MDGTVEETKKADPSNIQPSTVWNTLREFLLFTLALSGGFALMDLYKHGQSIREYLLRGAFIGAFIVLGGLSEREASAARNPGHICLLAVTEPQLDYLSSFLAVNSSTQEFFYVYNRDHDRRSSHLRIA